MRNSCKIRPRDGLVKFGLSICPPTIFAATLLAGLASAPLLANAAAVKTASPYIIEACPKPLVLHLRRAETAELEGAYQSFEFCGTHFSATTNQGASAQLSLAERHTIAPFASGLKIVVTRNADGAQIKLAIGTHMAALNLPIDGEETVVRWEGPANTGGLDAAWKLLVRTESVRVKNLFLIDVSAPTHDIARDFSKLSGYKIDGLELIKNVPLELHYGPIVLIDVFRELLAAKQDADVHLHLSGRQLRYVHTKTMTEFNALFFRKSGIDRASQLKRLLELAEQKPLQGYWLDKPALLEELAGLAYGKKAFVEGRRLYAAAVKEVEDSEFSSVFQMNPIATLTRFARFELDAGHAEFAQNLTTKALQVLERTHGPDHAAWAKILLMQANLLALQVKHQQAQAILARAIRIATLNGDSGSEIYALDRLAGLHEADGNWSAAEIERRRLVIRYDHFFRGNNSATSTNRFLLATALARQGKLPDAQVLWQELAELGTGEHRQTPDPMTYFYAAYGLRKLALIDIAAKRFNAASTRSLEIANMRESLLGKQHERAVAARIEHQTLLQLNRIELGVGVDVYLAPPQIGVLALKASEKDDKWRGLSLDLRREFARNLLRAPLKSITSALESKTLSPIAHAKYLAQRAEITLALQGTNGVADAIRDFSAAFAIRQKLEPESMASKADLARLTALQSFAMVSSTTTTFEEKR